MVGNSDEVVGEGLPRGGAFLGARRNGYRNLPQQHCSRHRNHSYNSLILEPKPAAMAASGRFIPYRRRGFLAPNIPSVPEKPVLRTECL